MIDAPLIADASTILFAMAVSIVWLLMLISSRK
jgi:hypothetical protein